MALTRRVALLAKVETTYGTDAAPTGANDAVLLQEAEITPMEAERIERPIIRPFLGARPFVLAGKRVQVRASVDLAGAGSAGSVPAYGPLLRGCGMAQAVEADVDVEYAPRSDGGESLTLVWNADGTQHKALGARGTWSVELRANSFPRLAVEYTGLYVAPTAVALPAVTLTAWRDPRPVGFTDTPVLTIDGYQVAAEAFSYSHGATVSFRDLVGRREVTITARTPTASVSIEAPALSAKNFFALADAQTPVAVTVQHGAAAGAIAEITLPQAQILNPRYRDSDGVLMLDLDLVPLPTTAGDDEVLLRIR
jgi:hypothetical protein